MRRERTLDSLRQPETPPKESGRPRSAGDELYSHWFGPGSPPSPWGGPHYGPPLSAAPVSGALIRGDLHLPQPTGETFPYGPSGPPRPQYPDLRARLFQEPSPGFQTPPRAPRDLMMHLHQAPTAPSTVRARHVFNPEGAAETAESPETRVTAKYWPARWGPAPPGYLHLRPETARAMGLEVGPGQTATPVMARRQGPPVSPTTPETPTTRSSPGTTLSGAARNSLRKIMKKK